MVERGFGTHQHNKSSPMRIMDIKGCAGGVIDSSSERGIGKQMPVAFIIFTNE